MSRRWLAALVLVVACGDSTDDPPAMGSSGAASSSGSTTASSTTMDPSAESTGADGSSSGDPLPEVVFEDDVQPLLNANCTCHLAGSSGMMTAPTLNLNPGSAHANLVGVAAVGGPGSLVEAGSVEDSYLWHKVNGTHLDAGGAGDKMPPAVDLDADQLLVLEAWIASGAEP